MRNRSRMLIGMLVVVCAVAALSAASLLEPAGTPSQSESAARAIAPTYDGEGALVLPKDWRRWVFVGASLGLSYSQGGHPGMEMFHETLMEPTAYAHFAETGTFREGSMFVLVLHDTGEGVLPARRGRFAAQVQSVEMAVKDSARRAEGWAYYNFGGTNGLRDTAQAMPQSSCYNCHVQHAKFDNVFLQFYPLLEGVAPRPVASHAAHAPAAVPGDARRSAPQQQQQQQPPPQQTPATPLLAIKGLDPVLLVGGREELGKPEIVAVHERYQYRFVSEPNRAAFERNPEQYAIRNDSCPVVPGAPVDPSLFVVHEGRIYVFASADCVQQFKRRPSDYVKP